MITRRGFLAGGAGCALFPREVLERDERLAYELKLLRERGVLGSMVWAAEFCKRHPPATGVGAVPGSLVAYTLGLTRIDPIEHGLYFERFANPASKSPPWLTIAASARAVGRATDPMKESVVELRPGIDAWGLAALDQEEPDPWDVLMVQSGELAGRLRPRSVEGFALLMALDRPGAGVVKVSESFVRRRDGTERIGVDHPAFAPILRETLGLWVYQEQVMLAAERIAGFTASEADWLRKVLGRRRPDELRCWRRQFVEGAATRGHGDGDAIFEEIARHAGYTFCKAHALAWAEMVISS